MPQTANLLFWDFFGLRIPKNGIEGALFLMGMGGGGRHLPLGTVPRPAQRHVQDDIRGGAMLSWGT